MMDEATKFPYPTFLHINCSAFSKSHGTLFNKKFHYCDCLSNAQYHLRLPTLSAFFHRRDAPALWTSLWPSSGHQLMWRLSYAPLDAKCDAYIAGVNKNTARTARSHWQELQYQWEIWGYTGLWRPLSVSKLTVTAPSTVATSYTGNSSTAQ